MSVVIKAGGSSNLAEVDANGNLGVNLPTTIGQAGYAVIAGEAHSGASGAARVVRAARVSTDGRLRAGNDSLYWQDTFNHAQQDTSAYQIVTSTATTSMTGGYWVYNAGNSVASGAVARIQTYRTFQLNAFSSIEIGFRARFALAPQTNNVVEFGLGIATTTTTPTDGVYFKLNSAGALVGVININGTETTTGSLTAPSPNVVYYYRIVIDQDRVEFFIDDVLGEAITIPNTASGPALARALPLLTRLYNSAATSSAQRFELADVSVLAKDLHLLRPFPMVQSGMCASAITAPRGTSPAQLANYANSAAPASATLSNTAAGYTTPGGQWQFAAVAGAETDYALFAYQVPAAAAASGNRNLYITGIRIEAMNTVVAVATTATVMQWAIAFGSTAVSLATTDSATAGTRGPRRIALGLQTFPVGATVGATATPINHSFRTPQLVEAGTFVHVILKMPIATATATEIFRGTVMLEGFFE